LSNLEALRTLLELWNTGDDAGIIELLDPEAELRPLRAQLEGTEFRGAEGLRQMRAVLERDWEDLRFAAEELRENGDLAVSLGQIRATGRVSGVELDVPIAFLWRFRDGKVVFAQSFSDPAEALRAAGIED
jgi:ketosteroid isomerase-like protein